MVVTIIDVLLVTISLAAFAFGLRIGVTTLILLRPLCDRLFEAERFDIGGHALSYGAIMNIVVICAMVLNMPGIRRRMPSSLKNIWLPFLLVSSVGVLYSPVQVDALRKLLTYLSFYSMFAISFVVVKSERDILFFLKVVILSSVLPVLYGLFQMVSGIDWYRDFRIDSDFRIASTFTHPNILAFYLVTVIGTAFFLMASASVRISGRHRLLLNLYLIPIVVILIMTKTRSAWAACFMLFVVYGLVYDRKVLIPVALAPVLALVVPAVNIRVMDLMSRTDYIGGPGLMLNSYAWRELLWENAMVYFFQRPIFGYGLDSFFFYSSSFFHFEETGTDAHNVYIQFLVEIGIVGLISFLWIFWRCLTSLIRCWRYDKRGLTLAAALMAAYVVCAYSDNLFEYLSFDWCFWFAYGVIFCHAFAQYRSRAGSRGRRMESRRWLGIKASVAGANLARQAPRLGP